MENFENNLAENLLREEKNGGEPPKKRERKGRAISCAIFPSEVQKIEMIKDRGLDVKLVLTPSKIAKMGIVLLTHLTVEQIAAYEPIKNTAFLDDDTKIEGEQSSPYKRKKKYKFFTFTIDQLSFDRLSKIIDEGFSIKRAFTMSELVRIGIQLVFGLGGEGLKDYYKKINPKNFLSQKD